MSLQLIWRRETALPCPLYHSGAAGIEISRSRLPLFLPLVGFCQYLDSLSSEPYPRHLQRCILHSRCIFDIFLAAAGIISQRLSTLCCSFFGSLGGFFNNLFRSLQAFASIFFKISKALFGFVAKVISFALGGASIILHLFPNLAEFVRCVVRYPAHVFADIAARFGVDAVLRLLF